MTAAHPYYPRDLEINNYVPNSQPMSVLLTWVGVFLVVFLVTLNWIASLSPHMKPGRDRVIFCWFGLCALTHCSFEAYWVWFNKTVATRTDIPAKLFREYANSDSRYMVSDPLVLTLETMTVTVIGPLCVLAMIAIYNNSPTRHLYQLTISVFHLFSCSLYYILDSFEGFPSCNPDPVYFWVYFVGFNSPWIVVPLFLVFDSWSTVRKAMSRYQVRWERPIKDE